METLVYSSLNYLWSKWEATVSIFILQIKNQGMKQKSNNVKKIIGSQK